MRKTIIYLSAAFLFFFLTGNVYGADKNEALFDKLSKTYILNSDGSQEVRIAKELTLYTHNAMNGTYGETFITYNPEYQKLVIHSSYTRQRDGSIVKTPENAFVEVLPRGAADAVAYNHLKEMVVVHTGLELGATIYLDYSIISKAGYLPALDVYEPLKQSSPVAKYTVKVVAPENTPLSYTIVNGRFTPKVSVKNGVRTVVWNISNLSTYERGDAVTVQGGNLPMLAVNSYKSAACAAEYLSGQIRPLSASTLDAVLKDMGDASVEAYVQSNFSRISLSLKDAGFRIRPLEEVYASAYGTDAELKALTWYLMKEKGQKADVVAAFQTRAFENRTFPLSAISALYIDAAADRLTLPSTSFLGFVSLTSDGQKADVASRDMDIEESKEIKVADEGRNGYIMVALPTSSRSALAGIKVLNTRRNGNYLLPFEVDESYRYEIVLPQGYDLAVSEGVKSIENKAGQVSFSVKKEGGRVVVEKKIELEKELIAPALYKDFRTLVSEWNSRGYNQVVLEN